MRVGREGRRSGSREGRKEGVVGLGRRHQPVLLVASLCGVCNPLGYFYFFNFNFNF